MVYRAKLARSVGPDPIPRLSRPRPPGPLPSARLCHSVLSWRRLGVLLLMLTAGRPLAAQSFDAVGTRAHGMGGAFVAVADDATATWWNPAGLAAGPFMNVVVEYGQIREPGDPSPVGPGARFGTSGFALAMPALGLSYYRLRLSEMAPADSIGAAEPGRQDQGTAGPLLRSTATTAFGVTVGQSLGEHVVVASTLRLLRAGAVVSTSVGGLDPLDQADDLSVPRETKGDLDVGVLLRFGGITVGGAVKHVGEPEFGEDGGPHVVLKRQARAGVAAKTRGKTGVFDSLTGAVDVDLTSTESLSGDVRRLAMGGEAGVLGGRIAVRGGLGRSTIGEQQWNTSVGASVALPKRMYVDGAMTPGSGDSRQGWSVSLRSSF